MEKIVITNVCKNCYNRIAGGAIIINIVQIAQKKGVFMRMKKILSLLIAVVMVLSVFGINVFADSTTTTYYLSANGNDSANGTTQQTPFRTFKKVCQMANGKDITVKIIGTFTGNDKDYDTHTGTITIEGIDSSSTFAIQAGIGYTTGGPVIFKNIKYSQGSSAYFFANGSKIVFDSGYSNVQTGQTIILGSRVSTQTTDSINAEVKDGVFGSVFHIGSIVPSNRNTVLNDANVFVDGGTIKSLVIGSNGTWATNKGNTFAKNVVIRQDSGMITKISATTISGAETKIEGALILVFNNGTQSTLDPSLDKISIGSRYYVYSGNGGKVIPHKGSDGNVEVGKFDLLLDEDCYGANILNGAESTLVEESGTITLEPGTTTIEYIKEQKYYVNASSGSDSNNGYTEQTPVKTIGAAVSRANGRDFTVVIMNNYAASTSIADHSGLMIITGYDENAKFGIPASYGISLGGKTKFENIKFENGSNSYYYMKGNELVMGDGVEASGYHQIIAGSLGKEVTEKGNVTINSGEFNRLTLGNIATSVTNSITKDISAVVNGGKVTALIIGNDGWSASSHKGVTYNGNVLLQVNGGSITNIYGNATYPATLNGAVQFIFNNGSSSNFGDSFKNYRADCGEYYIYSEEGGRVDFVYDDGGNSVTGEFYLTVPNGMYADDLQLV